MNVLKYAVVWFLTLVFMSIVDLLWHGLLFGKVYSSGLAPFARMEGSKMAFNLPAVLLTQLLFVTAVVFIVLYTVQTPDLVKAGIVGSAAGVLAISVYGITNYAIMKDWNLTMTVLELVWGPIIGCVSGVFIVWIRTLIMKT